MTITYEFQACRHRHRTANGYIITMTFNVPPNQSGQFSRRKLSTRCTGFQIRASRSTSGCVSLRRGDSIRAPTVRRCGPTNQRGRSISPPPSPAVYWMASTVAT
jgi:hypothetical protein